MKDKNNLKKALKNFFKKIYSVLKEKPLRVLIGSLVLTIFFAKFNCSKLIYIPLILSIVASIFYVYKNKDIFTEKVNEKKYKNKEGTCSKILQCGIEIVKISWISSLIVVIITVLMAVFKFPNEINLLVDNCDTVISIILLYVILLFSFIIFFLLIYILSDSRRGNLLSSIGILILMIIVLPFFDVFTTQNWEFLALIIAMIYIVLSKDMLYLVIDKRHKAIEESDLSFGIQQKWAWMRFYISLFMILLYLALFIYEKTGWSAPNFFENKENNFKIFVEGMDKMFIFTIISSLLVVIVVILRLMYDKNKMLKTREYINFLKKEATGENRFEELRKELVELDIKHQKQLHALLEKNLKRNKKKN